MGRFGELLRRVAPLFEVAGASMVVLQVVNVLLDDEEAAQHGATSCPIYLEGIPRDGYLLRRVAPTSWPLAPSSPRTETVFELQHEEEGSYLRRNFISILS